MSTTPPVKPLPFGLTLKNSLQSHSLFFTLIKDVVEIITHNIPELAKLATNQELLLLVCRIIEIKMVKNDSGLDKKELVVAIYCELFDPLGEAEQAILRQNIQFLYDNNKIKGVSIYKTAKAAVADWVSRRIL